MAVGVDVGVNVGPLLDGDAELGFDVADEDGADVNMVG